MLWLGIAGLMMLLAAGVYLLSGRIETRRVLLKSDGGLSRRKSEEMKAMSANVKRASYVFVGAAAFCLWLHFGLGW